jgi:uncharacterized protein (TIGR03437 family)
MNLNRLGTYLLGGTVALLLMAANAAAQPASVLIVVNTVGGNGTFLFTNNLVSSDISVTTVGGTGQTESLGAQGFPATLSEVPEAGWTLTSSSCTTGTPASFMPPNTCTFNNTYTPPPTVTATNPLPGATGVATGSTLTVQFSEAMNPTTLNTTTFTVNEFGLTPVLGTVSMSGTSEAIFTPTNALTPNSTYGGVVTTGAQSAGGAALATSYTWNFTTAPSGGSITVVMNSANGNGIFPITSSFSAASPMTTVSGAATQTISGLTPGSYSVSETLPAGWTQTSAICNNSSTIGAILVTAGVTTTCTFTNTEPPGSIMVVKNTVGADGTFTFTDNLGITGITTSGNMGSQTIPGLIVGGGYSIFETVVPGWTQTSATCTHGTPSAIGVLSGVTTICTFTNTQQGGITVVKDTASGNGTFGFTSNFGVSSLTTSGYQGQQTIPFLNPGSGYNIAETAQPGWIQTGATCTNGTPAAITVAPGATTVCTFTNAQTGSITITDNSEGGGNGTFAFTSNFGVSSLTTILGTASQTVPNLIVGASYSISQILPPGWAQAAAFCSNGTIGAITVAAGVTTTCTFNNVPAGSITVVKNTVGGNGTFAFTSNFGLTSLTTTGGTASQTFNNLLPDKLSLSARRPSPEGPVARGYNVSEIVPSGWIQTSASCTNGTPANVIVRAGATTVCTFINTPQQGSITVVENTLGGNGTFAFASNFGLASLTTIGGTASQTFTGLTPGGSYNVSETAPAGWNQTGASCTNGTPAAVTVAAGATTICTFTNTQPGSITITENTLGGNGTFAFTSNFGLASLTTIAGTASRTFSGLAPGFNYSVSEIAPAGWTETGAVCTAGTPASITVQAGATTTCIITNTAAATPAALIFTVPANGAIQVTTSSNVVANFNQLLNTLLTNTITFTLKQGTTPIPGTVTFAGTFATFDPTFNLAPNTQYTATLTSTATNPAARLLTGSYVWSFTTGASIDQAAVCLSNFAVLSGAGIVNRGASTITGDIGVSPGASVTGFPPGTLTGTIHPGDAAAAQGILDLSAAYANAVARLVGAVAVAGDLGGQTFTAGLYNSVSSLSIISGNLTLDAKGDPNAIFIFQMASTLTTAPGSQVVLAGGASASNIFWQVGTSATLGANSVFSGSILANQAITLNTGAAVNGRLLAENGTVTLASNIIASPPPSISVGGFVNAASDAQTAVAGSIESAFGHNLGSALTTASGYPLPMTLGGSSFQVGTQGAPLYMTSCSQQNIQIPWDAVGQVTLTATVGGLVSAGQAITIVPFSPGIFSLNQGGSGQGAVEIAATGQLAAPLADAGVPVKPGQYIAIYATGLGPVSNEPATGAAALSDPLSSTLTVPIVTIGGAAATVTYSGLAPGFAGLYQVNALVPDGAPTGDSVSLVISIGGVQSNTVTIAVQ